MEKIPREQIMKRFQSIPTSLQDAVFAQSSADVVLKTCTLRDVPDEKMYLVGQLTTRVLLGYVRPENFAAEIQKETGVDGMKAAQVAHDIDGEIFSAVRLELKKLYPPTIQTPTVQSQGFVSRAPEPPAVAVRRSPEPARPYVVPIPEKFRAKSAWPSHPTPIVAETQTPTPTPPSDEKKEVIPMPVEHTIPTPTPQPVPAREEPKPVSAPLSDIKPIVPLPTFIQSKFKETLKQTTGEKQTTQENPAMKGAFTKFTESHTAVKPTESQRPESVYREQIAEPQKTQDRAPMGETQKAEGKVVDLSGL